jgi:predicted SpoU family rRNA methylase
MEKQFKVETMLAGEVADLYEAVLGQFEVSSSLSLSEMNRALLQTGLMLHLTMMTSMGVVADAESKARLDALVETVGQDNLMWEVVQLARRHWQEGGSGSIDMEA